MSGLEALGDADLSVGGSLVGRRTIPIGQTLEGHLLSEMHICMHVELREENVLATVDFGALHVLSVIMMIVTGGFAMDGLSLDGVCRGGCPIRPIVVMAGRFKTISSGSTFPNQKGRVPRLGV